jgi:periplasmic divalent cation tolerance protein
LKTGAGFALVLVTVPNKTTARKLARAALDARLVACANIVPAIESHYWWQGQIEQGRELLVIFKTKAALLVGLEKLVLSEHPYNTPEFLVLNLPAGNARYLAWLGEATKLPRA